MGGKAALYWISRAVGTVAIGALAAFLLSVALPRPASELERKREPLTTHEGMLLVRCTFHHAAPPTIEEVAVLAQGRVTVVARAGEYAVELLDKDGQVLYRLAFEVLFQRMSDPPVLLEQVEQSVVLPLSREMVTVRVVSPEGQVEQPLPAWEEP